MSKSIESSQISAAEIDVIRAWTGLLASANAQPAGAPAQGPERHSAGVPFSFTCGARSSREWVKPENTGVEQGEWREGKRIWLLRWRAPENSLACVMELTEFSDFPAMEWVVRLRNEGSAETEPVANFKALDIFWRSAKAGEMPELRRAFGGDGRQDDFQYVCEELRHSMWNAPQKVRMDTDANCAFRKVRNGSPLGTDFRGSPSGTWLPFFNLRTGGDGIIGALGWSGQWFAEFDHDGKGQTDISAGMEHLELKLRPGEEIRSPRVLLLHWQGAPIHAHNVLRQFILKFHSPCVNGRLVEMPVCNLAWGGTPTAGHLEQIRRIAEQRLSYDYYWIDAGWYGTAPEPCLDVFHGKWWIVGDWRVNPHYHPDGLRPVSDAVHRAGMKLLLWIEPERALYGTPVTIEHPEWFLRCTRENPKPNETMVLNLGHPGARQWAVETISSLITGNGISCYREDFNVDPGPFWANADEEGRKGLTEMRFVEGLYAFWDELRRRHPGLLIDNCHGGGRRLDLETISRSVALWRTDYSCFSFMKADASQLHSAGLNLWLPLNAAGAGGKPGDTYQVRSAFSAGLDLGVKEFGLGDFKTPDSHWDWYRKMIGEAKRLRPFFLGDFYPLTPCIIDPGAWMAYQLHIPGKQEGAVVAFRRAESPMTAASFQLHDLRLTGGYEFEDADTGKTWRVTGRQLMTKGLAITADTPRTSRLMFYWQSERKRGF